MREQSPSQPFSIDLGIAEELRDEAFRNQFFRAEREIDIPHQLKALRKARGLNQAELAEKSGMKQSAISRIENSTDGKFNLETLVRLSEAMGARLAVIIEPYEAVVSRYLEPAQPSAASAATAQTEKAGLRNVPTESMGQGLKMQTLPVKQARESGQSLWKS